MKRYGRNQRRAANQKIKELETRLKNESTQRAYILDDKGMVDLNDCIWVREYTTIETGSEHDFTRVETSIAAMERDHGFNKIVQMADENQTLQFMGRKYMIDTVDGEVHLQDQDHGFNERFFTLNLKVVA